MERNIILTFFKKYRIISLIGIIGLLILTGCTNDTTPIDSTSTGIFDHYLVYPFSLLIKKLALFFNGSYGISIIIITIIIRLIIMPFMIKQTKSGQETQEKMKIIKPEMDEIQEKYRNKKGTETQLEMQQELAKLYKKHNFNPLQSVAGCLPMLIQLPFLIAFYYAIRRTPEIATETFLWFNLGQTDLILVVIAIVIYYLQARVSLIGLTGPQRKQMAFIALLSPIMIGIISLNVPAALPLYWAVGGLFILIQTWIVKNYITVT